MKLSNVQIDRYGIFNNFRLSNLTDQFNLIHGGNGTGKTLLARYIRQTMFGTQDSSTSAGHLTADFNHAAYRLVRDDSTSHQLSASQVNSHASNPASVPRQGEMSADVSGHLQSASNSGYEVIFNFDPRNVRQSIVEIGRLMTQRLGVPMGDSNSGNEAEYAAHARQESDLKHQLQNLVSRISSLRDQRNTIVHEIESSESSYRSRIGNVESEISELNARIGRSDLHSLREHVNSLDAEIAQARLLAEQEQQPVQYASQTPHNANESLAILYRRLDEVDNQIRSWRNIHSDVQQQRVQLKDEMTRWNSMSVESHEHPYHRSREILRDIEERINNTEGSIHQYRNGQNSQDVHRVFENVQSCFEKLRGDLYTLCDELGTQYKNIRHRSAAAELKRLRRCYHEIGDNLESLIAHRHRVLEDIRHMDPQGAAAISRAELEFCNCAQHEGYLQARRKYLGELTPAAPTRMVPSTDGTLTLRLRELEELRAARVRDLVAAENEINELQSRLIEKQNMRDGMALDSTVSLRDRLIQIDTDLASMDRERLSLQNRIDTLVPVRRTPATPLMVRASELADQLTLGEVRRLWWSDVPSNAQSVSLQIEQKSNGQIEFDMLSSGLQQQTSLALSLAVAEHLRSSGMQLPMVLDDVFVNLDPELIRRTLDVLLSFTQRGNQVLAMSSDQTVLQLCRSQNVIVFDLPDTQFTPSAPAYQPDRSTEVPMREPEFLTPFTTRQHVQIPTTPIGYPQIKYPVAGPTIDHSASHFDYVETVSTTTEHVQPLERTPSIRLNTAPITTTSEDSRLEGLRIVSSDQLNRLSQLGISTLRDLLDVNPHHLPQSFNNVGISQAEIDGWQSISWLLICVPSLQVEDAQILNAIGINEPEQLESTHGQQLQDRISRFINSKEGRRYADSYRGFGRDQINGWYDSLSQTRSRWRLPSGYSRRNRWRTTESKQSGSESRTGDRRSFSQTRERRPERRSDRRDRSDRNRASESQRSSLPISQERRKRERSSTHDRLDNAVSRFSRNTNDGNSQSTVRSTSESQSRSSRTKTRQGDSSKPLKFYLDLSDQLEAAPSIGPKTAERFIAVGIRTVGEFLDQTAESIAEKINYKRITADVIRTWQHHARLVCRIPNLRGHDSQLLVACGITEPEDLAERSPSKLFAVVEPFSETKEGLKIIRGGKQPDLAEITDWINWAKHTRSLQAA